MDPCECHLRDTMDLPCYHFLLENTYIEERKCITLAEIGTRWYMPKSSEMQDKAVAISTRAMVARVDPPDYPLPSASQLRQAEKRKSNDDEIRLNLSRHKRSNVQSTLLSIAPNDSPPTTATPASAPVNNSPNVPLSSTAKSLMPTYPSASFGQAIWNDLGNTVSPTADLPLQPSRAVEADSDQRPPTLPLDSAVAQNRKAASPRASELARRMLETVEKEEERERRSLQGRLGMDAGVGLNG